MKRTKLIMLFILSAIIFQSCKKDVVTSATSISVKLLNAAINGAVWIPHADSINTAITYNDALKTKTFGVTGTYNDQRIVMSVSLPNATNANNFTLASYKIDSTSRVKFALYSKIGDDFEQVGNVEPGSGTITVTAIDSTQNLITGTFNFTAKKVNYNTDGSIQSIDIDQVLIGEFNNLHYNFISN